MLNEVKNINQDTDTILGQIYYKVNEIAIEKIPKKVNDICLDRVLGKSEQYSKFSKIIGTNSKGTTGETIVF